MVLAIALGALPANLQREYPATRRYELVFPRDRVCRLDIHLNRQSWIDSIGGAAHHVASGQVGADVALEGLIFKRALLSAEERFMPVGDRVPFRLRFGANTHADSTTLGGFSALAFSPAPEGVSIIRAAVVADLLQASGLPAPAVGFMRVYLDHGDGPAYLGVYVVTELHTLAGHRQGTIDDTSFVKWIAMEAILGVGSDEQRRPFTRLVNGSEAYQLAYLDALRHLLTTVFEPSRLRAVVEARLLSVTPYLFNPEAGPQERDRLQEQLDAVYGANGLLKQLELRIAAARRTLDESPRAGASGQHGQL